MFILASIVGRSFDNLNDCFGLILLFEITFNFIVVIMIIMSYIIKVQAVTWQSSCYLIGELIKNLASLILICSFSEKIRNKVRYIGCSIVHTCAHSNSNFIFKYRRRIWDLLFKYLMNTDRNSEKKYILQLTFFNF